jgi:hypothetical protein
MSKLNIRSSFIASEINPILKEYGIDLRYFDEKREEEPQVSTEEILERLIEDMYLSAVMVSVVKQNNLYHVTVADEPKDMSAQIGNRMRVRMETAQSYINWPSDFQWNILTKHILQNELALPQRLSDLACLCAFDEDTDMEGLRANLEDVRERLQKIVHELNKDI